VLAFATPQGQGSLTLGRKDNNTTVKLTHRKPAEAEKQGIAAKPGFGRIMIGSMIEAEAVVTIDKQTFKVAPGAGQKTPDGPKLDLRPGTYKATIKVPGKPAFTEELKIAAGETWGLMIAPGGAMALNIY
jgi:hypothetical protein